MTERSAFSRPISAAFGKATGVFSRPKLQRRPYTAHTAGELISRLPHIAIDFNAEKLHEQNLHGEPRKQIECEEIVFSPCLTTRSDLNYGNNNNNGNNTCISTNNSSSMNINSSCSGSINSDNNYYNYKEIYNGSGQNNITGSANSTATKNNNNNNNNQVNTKTNSSSNCNNSINITTTANKTNDNNTHNNALQIQPKSVNFPHREMTRKSSDDHLASKSRSHLKTDGLSMSDRVKDIVRETLKSQLAHMEYRHRECGEKGRIISQLIEKSIQTLIGTMYKVTVLVYIGALRDEGIELACQCSWSPGIDFFAMETYRTQNIFASATVFATIYE